MPTTLSPYGSSALVTGSLRKGVLIMLLGGVLAWLSGQSWSLRQGGPEVFALVMTFGTLVAVAIPAQLVAGPRGMAWLTAAAGATGLTVPWFFALAVARQGQGVVLPSLLLLLASWLVTYAVCRLTRKLAWPRPVPRPNPR